MKRKIRAALLAGAALAAGGCGDSGQLPQTKIGSFTIMEGAVNDIVSAINSPNYRPISRDLGTDSDRIGLALMAFTKEAQGTRLEADAQEIKSRFEALEKLAASRAPLERQREAAKALQDALETARAKL